MPDIDLQLRHDPLRADGELPRCPYCGERARPNVYFLGDTEEKYVWEGHQEIATAFSQWLDKFGPMRLLMLEVGCGTGAPGLRLHAENYLTSFNNSYLTRINDSDATGPSTRFTGFLGRAVDILADL